ncbi:MAG: VWA domain-containing protein [Candidatus Omnitrophica bacterium]|nr:VWA domain-containing protein [Candidatus Omnitrophota bacterium]
MLFHNPLILVFVPLVIAGVFLLAWKGRRHSAIKFSSGELLAGLKGSFKVWASKYAFLLRALSLALFVVALARPQSPLQETEIIKEGIDIVLVIDVSTSMRAEDFELQGQRMNRLAVVKDVVRDFINSRNSDRIGLIAFAARPYTVCPLTLDYNWLQENLDRVEIGIIEDTTAIGSALAAALNRLKDTNAKSKIIILLTDGVNNAGKISPLTAAEAAKALGVRVYTIGAGTRDLAPYPFKDPFGNTVYRNVKIEIDEDTLRKIAAVTGGIFYRAVDTASLRTIYHDIDRLEKTAVSQKGFLEYKELFPLFLVPALILLLFEIVLSNTVFRKLP